jgi:hypothetical protein
MKRSALWLALLVSALGLPFLVQVVDARHGELPNRIPEPAPYNVARRSSTRRPTRRTGTA